MKYILKPAFTMKKTVLLATICFFLFSNHAFGQWVRTAGLQAGCVRALAARGGSIYAGTDSGGVFLSTNDGTSWIGTGDGLTNKSISALAACGGDLFAGTSGGGVFISRDSGASWTGVNNGLTDTLIRALMTKGGDLFAATNGGYVTIGPSTGYRGGVFRTENNGLSWTSVMYKNSYMVTCLCAGDSAVVAGTNGGGVFFSRNNGATWSELNSGLGTMLIQAVAFSGKSLFAVTYDPSCEDGSVFRTTIDGAFWSFANSGLTNQDVRSFCVSGGTVFAATDGGIFVTMNDGESWLSINDGLDEKAVLSLCASDSIVFAGTDSGSVFKRRLSDITASVPFHQPNDPLQTKARINVCCEKNSFVTITYALQSCCFVRLGIYTISGKMAAMLDQGNRAAGEHVIRFERKRLPAGSFVFRFQAGRTMQTGRLALAR